MWLKVVAFLLLLLMYWWSDLPLFWSPVDLAAHFTECEREYDNEVVPQLSPLIE